LSDTADPDIAVGRNYYLQLQNQGPQICSPNDPDFPQQWGLPDMNYPAALCRARPTRIPAMTYIDSGVNPVFPFELALIQQLNFANGADGKREFPFDADTNGNGYHGTSTSGTGGATTNDHEFIAGVASVREPIFITMLRVADPPGTTITSADLVDAFAWCLDHQQERGGPGPINVSINSSPPFTLNTFPPLQALSQSLEAQGDLVVNGAGNTGTEDSSPDSVGIRRVAGTDENNQLASFSTFGPFNAAAPATNILVFGAPTGGIGSPLIEERHFHSFFPWVLRMSGRPTAAYSARVWQAVEGGTSGLLQSPSRSCPTERGPSGIRLLRLGQTPTHRTPVRDGLPFSGCAEFPRRPEASVHRSTPGLFLLP
jgi:hypothetical protein